MNKMVSCICLLAFCFSLPACSNTARPASFAANGSSSPQAGAEPYTSTDAHTSKTTEDILMIDLNIQIEGKIFPAKLFNTPSAQALLTRLPLTVTMEDMNQNEKYHFLSEHLPAFSEPVESIHTGDLMLYGSNCLVLFYKDFETSYNYTKLGYVEDSPALADALGEGNVRVTFSAAASWQIPAAKTK